MNTAQIHLGFSIPDGDPVAIPLRHTVITGQTQEAGKTTTLEALISRSETQALTFVTKRGEGSFAGARHIDPYFKEQTDWKYVAAILEASRGEKLKWERAWIIRASKGARTLADVQKNVRDALAKAKGTSESAYLCLDAYLEEVVPTIGQREWARTVDLQPGVNVMDLERLPDEMQHLVIRSSIDWMLKSAPSGSLVVVPEAWKFIPEGRGTPVKLAAESFIRQAAGLSNYLWLDTQDISGVDKRILKSCPVWLLGVQRESNEIKHTLDQIPKGIARPSPSDIATLQLGEFFACWHQHVVKVYVQPKWLDEATAKSIAQGKTSVRVAVATKPHRQNQSQEEEMSAAAEQKLDQLIESANALFRGQTALTGTIQELARLIESGVTAPRTSELTATAGGPAANNGHFDEEGLYQRFKSRLAQEAPALIKVLAISPEIEVTFERRTYEYDAGTAKGGAMKLIAEGFCDSPTNPSSAHSELKRLGYSVAKPTVYGWFDEFAKLGMLTKEGNGFQIAPGVKKSIKPRN
jgi:hypothetical protein